MITTTFQTFILQGEDFSIQVVNWEKEPEIKESIDSKIEKLLSLSDEFVFPEYYSHTNKTMWKIVNIYTEYKQETLVLCGVDEGIEKAIDLAIKHISKSRNEYYGEQ